jgi:hypothetical protein
MLREYLHRVYQSLIQGSGQPRSRRVSRASRPGGPARLAVEGLEERTLLSTLTLINGGLVYVPSTTLAQGMSISDNSATHRYTFSNNAEGITLVGSFVNPSGSGTQTVSFGDGNINSITVNMSTVDFFNLNIEQTLGSAPLTVNMGTGDNTVQISPTAHNLDNILGAVTVHDGSGPDTVEIYDQAKSTPQNYTMAASSVTRPGSAVVTYGAGINSVNIYGGSGKNIYNVNGTEALFPTALNTGDGSDTVNVESTNGDLTVNLGSGTDILNVSPAAHNLDNIQGSIIVNAGSGVDTLNADDQASTNSQVYSPVSNALFRTLSAPILHGGGINFVNINGGSGNNTYNVGGTEAGYTTTLNTGEGNDTVNVSGTSPTSSLVINGGAGGMNVNVSPMAQNLDNIQGFGVYVNGQGGVNTLTVYDQGNSGAQIYTVTATTLDRTGAALITYGGIQSLTVYGSSRGNIMQVDRTAAGTSVALHGGGRGMSLYGSNAANTWTITGQDAGTLTSSLNAGTVTFTGAANLYGGNGNDAFFFFDGAGVDGTIDGGGGTNGLNYSAYSSTVLVDLQTGFATGVGGHIANIQNVAGGTGGGTGVYNILVGNGGNVLVGGDGRRNLLIAGASASTLIGGNDDDILIGGTTAYDHEAGLVSLQAIMNYWSSTTDDYGTRVANLLSGNGVPLLDATMVTNNGGGNTLMGNHGGAAEMNLFYGLDPTLETSDYNPGIGEQFINC